MPTASDFYGTVFERGSALLMARVTTADGQAITRADLASARYTIYKLDPCENELGIPVTGHDSAALVVDDILFDSMQTGDPWTIDAEGYNFRHELDVSTNEGFPTTNRDYQVRYELTPNLGQKVIFRFQLKAI